MVTGEFKRASGEKEADMTTTSPAQATPPTTTTLRLSSGNGPVTRTILSKPPREALPHEIPIIDISAVTDPSASFDERKSIADQIRTAAMTNGFFYVTNHGIPDSITTSAHQSSLNFFRQPTERKEAANSATHSKYHFGWKAPDSQRINPFEGVDKRESFSWRYNPAYDPSLSPQDVENIPAEVRKYIEVDDDDFPWSATTQHTPEFKRDVVALYQGVLGLGRLLVRSFALSLGLEEREWDDKFTFPGLAMAVNYYPPLDANPSTSSPASPTCTTASDGVTTAGQGATTGSSSSNHRNVSIGSHTDFQLFTLLYQSPSSSETALQVLSRCPEAGKTEDGEEIYQWLYARPIPGTFVVNFGDYMQRITNDLYPSTVHRVQNFLTEGRGSTNRGTRSVCPAETNSSKPETERNGERLSIAFFFGFNQDVTVEVLDSCVDVSKGESKKYDAISCHDWTLRRFQGMHDLGTPS